MNKRAEGTGFLNKRPKKQTKNKPKKLYLCFSCKQQKAANQIARHGTHRKKDAQGKRAFWHLCRECHGTYKQEREMDKQAYRAAQGDMRVGEKGSEQMGWNGVPSDRSLRRRSR
jgi:hypothetical protein